MKNRFRKSETSRRDASPPRDSFPEEPRGPSRQKSVMEGFEKVWKRLFSEPVHLDSALAQCTPKMKSTLAQIIPTILLRPASQAEAMGIGVRSVEPWSLSAQERASWRPARLIAERIYSSMSIGVAPVEGSRGDFPPQFLEECDRNFGTDTTRDLVAALSQSPPLGIRASRRIGANGLVREIRKEGLPVQITASKISPLGVQLSGYAPILHTEAFERGDFEIQDEGSQVMALFALWPERFAPLLSERPGRVPIAGENAPWLAPLPDPAPAWTIVDACAGAGGKSLAFADVLSNRGRLFSYDTSAKKLQALRRRATRAGYTNIQTVPVVEGQESATVSKFRRRANIVLVDAPCSGWGVLRRNPDIKWRQEEDVLARMPAIQNRILSEYSELVASGGRLVYGVCTFRKAETTQVVEQFLSEHPGFRPGPGGFLGPEPCDGFFMQAFERKK